MEYMSDEVKLEIIKEQLAQLELLTKVMMHVQTTLEMHRMQITNEIPVELEVLINQDTFKTTVVNAIMANSEMVQNMITIVDSIGILFGNDFKKSLPQTPEEFVQMSNELIEEAKKYAVEEYGMKHKEDN